jgi:gas vesicle protein
MQKDDKNPMNHNGSHRGASLALGFLAGAVTGAAVALVTAPQSGRRTRERLGRLARDAGGRASRMPGAVRQACGRAVDAARDTLAEAL